MDCDDIKKYITGLKLIDAVMKLDELHLTFEDDLTLILSGSYRKEVYANIKRRVITYEDVD